MRSTLVVWLSWTCLMASANLATPLYAVYAQRFHFSSLVLTLVFATYAFALVPSLVFFGGLSDLVGRRPVIVGGLLVACLALGVFALAHGTAWLYVARALQGVAVGMISGAATAALVEVDPEGDRKRAAMFAGLAQAGGSALGPIAAGVLAQLAAWPLRLPYVVGLGVTLVAAAAVALVLGPGGGGGDWRIQWPRLPGQRGAFARVSVTGGTVWAALALYLSLIPSYARTLLHTGDLAVLAAIAATALVASFAAQLGAGRLHARVESAQAAGLGLLAAGLGALVVASPLHSLALLLAGSVAAGVGHGIAFLNAQEELNELAPDDRRGEVTAAFIACIYLVVAAAVIAAGLLDLRFTLSVAVGVVSVALVGLALLAAAAHLRSVRSTREDGATGAVVAWGPRCRSTNTSA